MLPTSLKCLWEQLDGPQANAIVNAIWKYYIEQLDDILDTLHLLSIDTAKSSHLTTIGILANFPRPILEQIDTASSSFTFTEEKEQASVTGFSSAVSRTVTVDDDEYSVSQATGGYLQDISTVQTNLILLSATYYRAILQGYFASTGEIGSLVLLDEILYAIFSIWGATSSPVYNFCWYDPGDPTTNMFLSEKTWGDIYLDLQGRTQWGDAQSASTVINAILSNIYYPQPSIVTSMDSDSVTLGSPISSVASGSYTEAITITLSITAATEVLLQGAEALIYYTLDGELPIPANENTTLYTEPFTISESCELNCYCVSSADSSLRSTVATYTYTIVT